MWTIKEREELDQDQHGSAMAQHGQHFFRNQSQSRADHPNQLNLPPCVIM